MVKLIKDLQKQINEVLVKSDKDDENQQVRKLKISSRFYNITWPLKKGLSVKLSYGNLKP